jgi:hypothetical protein
MNEFDFKDLGFKVDRHRDGLSGYDWDEYTMLKTNIAYTIQEIAGHKDMYSVHVGSIISFVRNLTPGDLIFRGKIRSKDELIVLMEQLGITE